MPIGLGDLFVCIKYRGPKVRGRALLRIALLPPAFLGSRHCVFIHEIHNCIRCPSTYWNVHFLTCFALKGFEVWHGNGFHFDETARVEGFNLEDFSFGNDFAGFFVGSTANSGSCTEETLEDEHGCSLSGS